MTKLGKDLKRGDALSLTGWEIDVVHVRQDAVHVWTTNDKYKLFGPNQMVYLEAPTTQRTTR